MHKSLPLREDHSQNLNDDGSGDKRTDTKHDDREVRKTATREDVKETKELAGAEELRQCCRIDARNRNRSEKAEYNEGSNRKADPLAQDWVFEGHYDFSKEVLHMCILLFLRGGFLLCFRGCCLLFCLRCGGFYFCLWLRGLNHFLLFYFWTIWFD